MGSKGILPLRTFIQETLRRSRTSYSTLQVALYYLILIKPHVPKCDFTMEQPEDVHFVRALQCGRRMFLSALILASKYLQDRNYSARAWSKISGLNTQEINQNEMAFLIAVNWKLHIHDSVFKRWTEIVLKYTPTQPPSPGASALSTTSEHAQWKRIIMRLEPDLNNVEDLITASTHASDRNLNRLDEPRIARPSIEASYSYEGVSEETTPRPHVMEPALSALPGPSRPAPAYGLLPTPRFTSQGAAFSTPAASAVSSGFAKRSMSYALSQPGMCVAQMAMDKWPAQSASPQSYAFSHRPSTANSSPESMLSDKSSRASSRSSSISSASSLASAPLQSKLDVQARYRSAKLCESQNHVVITSSPLSYEGNNDCYAENPILSPPTSLDGDAEYFSINDTARALMALGTQPRVSLAPCTDMQSKLARAGSKRGRPLSLDDASNENVLQSNVRKMLANQAPQWSTNVLQTRSSNDLLASPLSTRVLRESSGRKRFCGATVAPRSGSSHYMLPRPDGPVTWEGTL